MNNLWRRIRKWWLELNSTWRSLIYMGLFFLLLVSVSMGLLFGALGATWWNTANWQAVEGISALGQAFWLIITIPFIVWQILEAGHARSAQVFLEISAQLDDAEMRQIRKDIYQHIRNFKPDQLASLTDEQISDINRVCVLYDRIGVLAKHGYLAKEVIFAMYWDSIVRVWCGTYQFIETERNRRNNDCHYEHFQWLFNQCSRYVEVRKLKTAFYDSKEDSVDLAKCLPTTKRGT